jgi:hypothetical protein
MEEISKIRKGMYACTRCSDSYSISNFSERRIIESFTKLTSLCKDCRHYKICPICNIEFKHHQNQTCSKECAKQLTIESYLKSEGVSHNFKKESKTVNLIKNRLFEEHGVINQFSVDSVKTKIKNTMIDRYGVDNISKLEKTKTKKKNTLTMSLLHDPDLIKRSWWKTHHAFIDKLGYDPRLSQLSQTSKESIVFFGPTIELLQKNKVKFFCGIDSLREFCIRDSITHKSYFYDLVIPKLKIVVEYNNCTWHAKSKDSNWIHPITKQTASENFGYFEKKMKLIESYGYETIIIWTDCDLLTQSNSLLNTLTNKINENKKN